MRSGEPFIFQGKKEFVFRRKKGISVATLSTHGVVVGYLHYLFTVGTTIAPKVDGRLYDGA